MAFFQDAKMAQAYLKAGFLGFAGSGKTYTSVSLAIGLHGLIKSKKPVFFIDTETGSDFMVRRFEKAKIKLLVAKKRAFKDLVPMCKEAEKQSDILITDSVSAFWNDLVESYKLKKNRNFVSFPDWGILKREWGRFSDWYITSLIHVIINGRAGWVYNETTGEEGEKQLEKIGTKMKAENEFGYEPSLLVEMERVKMADDRSKIGSKIVHYAHILKDRNDIMDGITIEDPKFEDFLPTIELLNLGGEHFALDTETDSTDMFDAAGRPEWQHKEEQRQIMLEEMTNFIQQIFPSLSVQEKSARLNLAQHIFKTTSRLAIEKKSFDEIKAGFSRIKNILSNPDNIGLLLSEKPDLSAIVEVKEPLGEPPPGWPAAKKAGVTKEQKQSIL